MTQESAHPSLSTLLETPVHDVADEAAMQTLGHVLAHSLARGTLITLTGELGAGKSVLARSIVHALGYVGRVKSPTYTLIETYEAVSASGVIMRVAHLDLYRLNDPAELDYLGFDDVLQSHDIVIIEWPEQGGDRIPPASVNVHIEYDNDGQGRKLMLRGP